MAHLPGMAYAFPPHVVQTEERPDIVAWNDKAVYLVELTIPFETGMVKATERKQQKYSNLIACCRGNGFRTILVTVEVGASTTFTPW